MIASSRQHIGEHWTAATIYCCLALKLSLALAKRFESLVEASSIFKIIYPVQWGLVCFQLKSGDNVDHENLARELKQNQETLITTSVWNGTTYLRATFNQFTTTENDVDEIFQKIEARAQFLKNHCQESNKKRTKIKSKAILKNSENIPINWFTSILTLFFAMFKRTLRIFTYYYSLSLLCAAIWFHCSNNIFWHGNEIIWYYSNAVDLQF